MKINSLNIVKSDYYFLVFLLFFPWSLVNYNYICTKDLWQENQLLELGLYNCNKISLLWIPPKNPYVINFGYTIVTNLLLSIPLIIIYRYFIRSVKVNNKGEKIFYYDNNKIWDKITPTDNKNEYYLQSFYESGDIKFRGFKIGDGRIAGKCFGLWEYFHENGVLKEKGIWELTGSNGIFTPEKQKVGVWEVFDENGVLLKTETYVNGKLEV